MVKKGWVKLHRSIEDWEWYKDLPTKSLFLHLLLKAEWSDGRRGYVLTTESRLMKELGLSRQQIRTAMSHLISTGEITKEVTQRPTRDATNGLTNKSTLINIENYSVYQGELGEANQDSNQASNQESNQDSNQSLTNLPYYIKNYNKNINKNIKESARARARHADGVSINDDDRLTPQMNDKYHDNLERMREKMRMGSREFYLEEDREEK